MASSDIKLKVSIAVDQDRLDDIFERARLRMRRLSRRKRKYEWQHIQRQIADCITVGVMPAEKANAD